MSCFGKLGSLMMVREKHWTHCAAIGAIVDLGFQSSKASYFSQVGQALNQVQGQKLPVWLGRHSTPCIC